MQYLLIKMRRDLLKMWTQFFSVFMMALLAVTIFAAMEGMYNGLDNELKDLYSRTNATDAVVYSKNTTDDEMDKIRKLDYVNNASASMSAIVKLKDSDKDMKVIATDDYSISKPYIAKGKMIDSDSDGILIDKGYSEENNLAVGDYITLTVKNRNQKLKIDGIMIHPEYVYYTGSSVSFSPDHKNHGYAMMSEKTAKKLFGAVLHNEIRIGTDEGFDSTRLQKDAEVILDKKYVGYGDRDSIQGMANPIKKVSQIKKMSVLFSSIFILLSLLTMQTTMTRLIKNQKIQIATLKALGFGKAQIIMHYAMYSFVIALLGGVCGIFLGPTLISPVIVNALGSMYTLPQFNISVTYITCSLPVLIAVICTLTTMFSCRKDLRGMVVEMLRGDVPSGGKKIAMERCKFIWTRIGFNTRWSFRDISENKVRTTMGIVGVFGCMMLLIAGLGMQNSLNYANSYVYDTEYTFNSKAVLTKDATDKNKDELESIAEGSNQWEMDATAEFKKDDKNKNAVMTICDKGNYINLENAEGIFKKLPDKGAFITRKTAEQLNVNKGDIIKFRIMGDDDYTEVKIKDIIICPSPQGVFMSKAAFVDAGKTFNANALLMQNKNKEDTIKELSYVNEYSTIKNMEKNANSFADSLQIIFRILIAGAILLAVVILYNLGVLSYTEKSREYATLKVLGFYQSEITKLALKENAFTTIIGWLIGIPMGFGFLSIYIKVVSIDTSDWVAKLSIARFIAATAITVGCSVGVSLLLSLKVKKINMVESLKAVE